MSKTQITATWDGRAYVPDQVFLEQCQAGRRDKPVTLTIEENRHPEFHAWFWAMLTAVCRSGVWDGDAESLLRYIKLGTNYGDWFPTSDGNAVFVPRSISFAKCDELRFRRFVFFAEKFLAERLSVDTATVFREADEATGKVVPLRRAA